MSIDLANGYSRKDGASASNLYYGYSYVGTPVNDDYVFSLRKVTTSAGVETVTWANGGPINYNCNWTQREFYFTAPVGSLALTYSIATASQGFNFSACARLNWQAVSGVSYYYITTKDVDGNLLNKDGVRLLGPNLDQVSYSDLVINSYNYTQNFIQTGTYSITLTGWNVAGVTASTFTFSIT